MRPLAIDLFCGLGGWTEGLLAEGYDVIGFDVEQHVYGEHRYPGMLAIQDVRTLHGSQFRNVRLIVASPPCQEYSYMAMPWKRAKQVARALRGQDDFPSGYKGSRTTAELTELFAACFRIQREASENIGRYIPLVVENVNGAQPWVGKAAARYGSFFLWGDVPAVMPTTLPRAKVSGMGAGWRPPGHPDHQPGLDFNTRAERQTKNAGGSWFNVAHNKNSGHGRNPVHDGVKVSIGADHPKGGWFYDNEHHESRRHSSKSKGRKAASARIAKIPIALAQHIALVYRGVA